MNPLATLLGEEFVGGTEDVVGLDGQQAGIGLGAARVVEAAAGTAQHAGAGATGPEIRERGPEIIDEHARADVDRRAILVGVGTGGFDLLRAGRRGAEQAGEAVGNAARGGRDR